MAKHRGTAGKSLIIKTITAALFGTKRTFRAYARGLAGEHRIGRALAALPEGWRVWHDLDIEGSKARALSR